MSGNSGLRLREDSVGVSLISAEEKWAEVWISGLGLGSAWAGDVEASGGVGRRARSD